MIRSAATLAMFAGICAGAWCACAVAHALLEGLG